MSDNPTCAEKVQHFGLDLCAHWKNQATLADKIGIRPRTLNDSLHRSGGMTQNTQRAMESWFEPIAIELYEQRLPLEIEGIPIPISEGLQHRLNEVTRQKEEPDEPEPGDDFPYMEGTGQIGLPVRARVRQQP